MKGPTKRGIKGQLNYGKGGSPIVCSGRSNFTLFDWNIGAHHGVGKT